MDSASKSIDIGRQRVGMVYGSALLRACHDKVDTILDELQNIVEDVFEQSPQLESILSSPRVTPAEKMGLIDRVFGGRVSIELQRFLKVVCQHGRLDCLRFIHQEAHNLRNEHLGVLQFDMVTARAVDDAMAQRVASALKQKFGAEVELRTLVDPKIIGGVVIRTEDKVYDASIARKLELMRLDAVQHTVLKLRQKAENFASE